MDKDELKNKISMALKDQILQQGFEIICKELAELKADNDARKFAMAISEKVEKQLREENAELKAKWLQATDEGTSWAHRKSLERENRKLKDQLTKAKNLLAKWVELFKPKVGNIPPTPIQVETEQFLNDEGCPDVMCEDCTKECGMKKLGLEVEK